jgi:hypothetical protein
LSDSPYGYLVFRIEIGDGPDQMVYFHPRKYGAFAWTHGGWGKDGRIERNPDDFYVVRCNRESFVRVKE